MNTTLKFAVALAATVTLAQAAELTGKITLKGTPPPSKPIPQVKADANCGKFHTTDVMTRTYLVGADGGLENVIVFIKGGLEGKTFPVPTEKPVIDQVGCMYEPYVSAIMAGQTFIVKNSDPLLHNVNASPKANKGFNVAQATVGQTLERTWDKPEMGARFACNVHPWMISYLSVMENPFFNVTDKDGKFAIKGNLPDGKYTVEAYHQKAGSVTGEVEVKGGKATLDLSLEVK
jgi:hypothetical protein